MTLNDQAPNATYLRAATPETDGYAAPVWGQGSSCRTRITSQPRSSGRSWAC